MAIGYDKLPLHVGLLFDCPMTEGTGTLANDISRGLLAATAHCNMTLTGAPAWVAMVAPMAPIMTIDFVTINTDFLECSAAVSDDLDFVAHDFSMVAWVLFDTLAAAVHVIDRGTSATNGWFFTVDANGAIRIGTNGAALVDTDSADAEIVTGTWYLIGATRDGANCVVYKNGRNVTDTAGTHVNPVAAAVKLHCGVDVTEAAGGLDGHMKRPRVWGDRVLTDLDMWEIFETERHLFNL